MIKKSNSPHWHSSYEKNNYGDFFYSLIRVYQPEKVVELGTKAGYSAYHMARGLKTNGKGSLDCYDLWQDYEFDSVSKSVAEKNLQEFKDFISLKQQDAFGIEKKYKTVDILHIDLSNEGGILAKIIPFWIDRARLIIIEGGSTKRDKIAWMVKYKKVPIKNWLKKFSFQRGDIQYITIEPFPSLTLIKKI